MEGLNTPVRVTSGHRFYSASREAWVEAHHLRVGETVRTRDGAGCRVRAVLPLPGEHEVFNIEVETAHQYHVTTAGLLTHNNGGPDCKTSSSSQGVAQSNNAVATGELYEVGTAAELRKVSVPGTEVNHFPGSAAASTLVGDLNPKNNFGNEAAIRLPISEHADVTAAQRALGAQASASDLLNAEKGILKASSNAPVGQIEKVERLAKDLHPYDFTDYSKLNKD